MPPISCGKNTGCQLGCHGVDNMEAHKVVQVGGALFPPFTRFHGGLSKLIAGCGYPKLNLEWTWHPSCKPSVSAGQQGACMP